MPLTERENFLRNASFGGPEYIPCRMNISTATWLQQREEVEAVVLRHPAIFPDFKKGDVKFDEIPRRVGTQIEDTWGCTWDHAYDGLVGQVVTHPLEDWADLAGYTPPDPASAGTFDPMDWDETRKGVAERKAKGLLTRGHLPHGFYFMRLYYLRGFDNFMCDVIQEPPELQQMCDMVLDHYWYYVQQFLEMGIDVLEPADDLGTQTQSMLGRSHFRRWVLPAYKALFQPCRERGMHVALHSDGYVLDIMDELIEAGVTICNPQDLCNGIDNLAREVKGRICIRLDIDRQKIVPFGTPADIRNLIAEEVRKLGSPQGGLELHIGVYPPTPPENIDAVLSAMEAFRTFWTDGRARAARAGSGTGRSTGAS